MATFWLSFRIEYKDVGGKSYEDRYTALTDALAAVRGNFWEETSSFMIFESDLPIAQIAARAKAAIAPTHDLFVIRELDKQSAIGCGCINDQDLFVLMPYAKKL